MPPRYYESPNVNLAENWIASELLNVRTERKCGVHPWERFAERPNLLLVSVRIYREYGQFDRKFLDYDPIRNRLKEWPSLPHIDTLEELAEELFSLAFENPDVLASWVRLSKPLIFSEAESAGIEVFRLRSKS